jgi:alpha-tubulin suppressor-like RCC1 family protein
VQEILPKLTLIHILNLRLTNKKLKKYCDIYLTGELDIKQIACGGFHSIILLRNGRVLVMGQNIEGQLGLGQHIHNRALPTEVLALPKIKSIAAGYFHTLLLSEDNEVWVFGNNDEGQLGCDNTVPKVFLPRKMDVSSGVVALAGNCDLTALLFKNNIIQTFGSTPQNIYVDDTAEIKILPVWLSKEHLNTYFSDKKIEHLSVSKNHALIITEEKKCYGVYNPEGKKFLGLSLEHKDTLFLEKSKDDIYITEINIFKEIEPLLVIATSTSSIILTDKGELFVTGNNCYKQLGCNEENLNSFESLPTLKNKNVVKVAANDFHTLMLTAENELLSMGCNDEGQLGLPNNNEFAAAESLRKNGLFKKNANTLAPVEGFFKLKKQLTVSAEKFPDKPEYSSGFSSLIF